MLGNKCYNVCKNEYKYGIILSILVINNILTLIMTTTHTL